LGNIERQSLEQRANHEALDRRKTLDPVTNPSVSVLMAEYNTPLEHLEKALGALLRQTFSHFEIVLVDDGGCNDLSALVSRLGDPRLRVVGDGVNRGFVAALNLGLSVIESDYVVRADTDDWVEDNFLIRLVESAVANPEFSVISARGEEVSEDMAPIALGTPGEKSAHDVMRGSTPFHPATIIRREALLEVGGYPDYHRAEDLALWCELLLAGHRLLVIDDILCHYRVERDDYKKRRIINRRGEIRARLHYYPMLGAGPVDYLRVLKSIISGLLPSPIVRRIRRWIYS